LKSRPNILWILTTQWRAQATGFSGDSNAHTPNLDALAARSLVFENAITPHPFGPFARAALISGLESPRNGVGEYYDPLPRTSPSIARELAEAGYETAFFGKWHLAPKDEKAPLVGEAHARQIVEERDRAGFSFWEGFEGGFQLNNPWLHGTRIASPVRFDGYQSRVLCERAADWLLQRTAQRPEVPWFCMLSLESPHPPYSAPADGVVPVDVSQLQLRQNVPSDEAIVAKARSELAGYYAHIEATDRALGNLLTRIETLGALVVFSSVHGDMHGSHGCFRKGWPYEESVHVPLLVGALGAQEKAETIRTGQRLSPPVTLLDVRRWTLGWAREGWNATPGAKRDFARISMPSIVRLPQQCDRIWTGLRTETRKLVLKQDGSPWLFFDLGKDPLEMNNLAEDPGHEHELAPLRRILLEK
jgi:arylsulfatase A-like enzyme